MSLVSCAYTQKITLWRAELLDDYGKPSYSLGEVFLGRWEDNTKRITTPNGEEVIAKSVVWVPDSVEVAINDKLALGDMHDQPVLYDASIAVRIVKVPGVHSICRELKAFVL